MSDTGRALALLLSVLVWSPVLMPLLRGEVSPDRALLLYAGAVALVVTGWSVLGGLVRAYAEPPAEGELEPTGRRREDR